MKKNLLLPLLFLLPFISAAQGPSETPAIKRNSAYAEIFGQGLYNSLSFDRLYNVDKKVKTSFSAGLTLIPSPGLFVVGLPVSYNFLFGQKNHHLELGIGFTAMYLRRGNIEVTEHLYDPQGAMSVNNYIGNATDFYSFFTPKVGYRYQRPEGGFFFRLSFTPPIAGINHIGDTKGGKSDYDWSYTEYFSSAAFFGRPVFPWGGLSFGWTLKN